MDRQKYETQILICGKLEGGRKIIPPRDIQPGIYGISLYWLTAFIILGSLVFSGLFFWITVLEKVLSAGKSYAVIIALAILTFSIQFVPDIKEAFYWYNGAAYYSFFFSLELIEATLLIRLWYRKEHNTFLAVAISVLAFFVSGGNYSNALTGVLITLAAVVVSFILKAGRKRKLDYILVFVAALTGLIISMIAPGNAVRALNNVQLSPIMAIWKSVQNAFLLIVKWTGIAQVGLMILLAVLFYQTIKNTKIRFRYPLLFLLVIFGLFASQLTPPLYAMSTIGAQRQINMYYYSYYLLISLVILYFEGWIVQKLDKKIVSNLKISKSIISIFILISIVCIGVGMYKTDIRNTSFGKTYLDLKSGRAQRYDAEYKRIEKLLVESEGVVYTSDINEYPNSFYRLGLSKQGEIGFWINKDMAKYYNLDDIILEE